MATNSNYNMSSTEYRLFLLAAFGVLGYGAWALSTRGDREDAFKQHLKQTRAELFVVADDCSSITFTGTENLPNEEFLLEARKSFYKPYVEASLAQARLEASIHGMTIPAYIAAKLLYEMFPECDQTGVRPWPVSDVWNSGTFGVIWASTLGIVSDYVPEEDK